MPGTPRSLDWMRSGWLGALLFAFMAAACSPDASPSPSRATGSPPSRTTPAPTASPTPPLLAHLQDLELLTSGAPGSWRAAGLLVSDSSVPHSGISLMVSLLDDQGTVLQRKVISPLFPDLLSGATVQFVADFQAVSGAKTVVAVPSAYLPSAVEGADVEAEVATVFTAEDGHTYVLGHLVSSDLSAARTRGLAVVVRNSEKQLSDVASSVIWSRGIGPWESVPFLAFVDSAPVDFVFEPLVEAVQSQGAGSGALVFDEGPRLVSPPRGLPFLLGSARNRSGEPQWLRGIVWLMYRGELLTLAEIRSPVPLAGGEALAFSLDNLPGLLSILRADPDAASEIDILARWDWAEDISPAPTPIPLAITITTYEAVGESLILRGVIRNPTAAPVSSATAFAAVRTLEGLGVAAGWATASELLAGDGESEVVLTLRLAEAIEPSEMEFDVRAFGLSP